MPTIGQTLTLPLADELRRHAQAAIDGGTSRADLARRAGWSVMHLWRFLDRDGDVTVSKAESLAAALEVTLHTQPPPRRKPK